MSTEFLIEPARFEDRRHILAASDNRNTPQNNRAPRARQTEGSPKCHK